MTFSCTQQLTFIYVYTQQRSTYLNWHLDTEGDGRENESGSENPIPKHWLSGKCFSDCEGFGYGTTMCLR
jgi:hypothetical protein